MPFLIYFYRQFHNRVQGNYQLWPSHKKTKEETGFWWFKIFNKVCYTHSNRERTSLFIYTYGVMVTWQSPKLLFSVQVRVGMPNKIWHHRLDFNYGFTRIIEWCGRQKGFSCFSFRCILQSTFTIKKSPAKYKKAIQYISPCLYSKHRDIAQWQSGCLISAWFLFNSRYHDH